MPLHTGIGFKRMLKIAVFIKQVPDTSSRAGVNADGTIDRAKAKRMLNRFDLFALQKDFEIKQQHEAEITAFTMGPKVAEEVLIEALEYGADRGVLLTDKRLAGSDTIATSYALVKLAQKYGSFDIYLTGLQTTDGDTAQVGPQMAERLGIPQITYCEELELKDGKLHARRILETGHQKLLSALPCLVTVANSASRIHNKEFHDVASVRELLRNDKERAERIQTADVDDIGADETLLGLTGSPTIVGKTWKIGSVAGSCKLFEGESAEDEVASLIGSMEDDNVRLEELL